MANTAEEVWQLLGELAKAQKETDRQIQELSQEVEKTSREVKRVSREIGNLGGKWGRFVENMVAPTCETLFVNRNIPVHKVYQRVKRKLNGKKHFIMNCQG